MAGVPGAVGGGFRGRMSLLLGFLGAAAELGMSLLVLWGEESGGRKEEEEEARLAWALVGWRLGLGDEDIFRGVGGRRRRRWM